MRSVASFLVIILAFMIGLAFEEAHAVTYYVSTSGNDSNSGTSDAQAFRTLQQAADTVQAGDTVIVRAGTYTAGFAIGWTGTGTAGTAQSPIKFLADSSVVITGKAPHTSSGFTSAIDISNGSDYITIQGFTINNNQGNMSGAGIWVTTSAHVSVLNNTCTSTAKWGVLTGFADYVDVENNILSGMGQHGIYIGNTTTSPIVRNNIAHNNGNSCIQLNGDKLGNPGSVGIIDHALIENNICYSSAQTSSAAGISLDGAQYSVVRNNLIYAGHGNGIVLFPADGGVINGGVDPASINNLIVNNTVVNSRFWAIQIIDGSTGNTVFNNILWNDTSVSGYNYGSIECDTDSASGFHSDYNIVVNSDPANGSFNTDPNDGTPTSFAAWQALAAYNHPDTHSIAVSSGSLIFANYSSPLSTTNDYHLKTGSKALSAGVTSLAGMSAPATDIVQATRYSDAMDLGAYQFSAGSDPMSNNPAPGSGPVGGNGGITGDSTTAGAGGPTASTSSSGGCSLELNANASFANLVWILFAASLIVLFRRKVRSSN